MLCLQKRVKMEQKEREGRIDYEQRRALANKAYSNWLRKKHEEDELAKRQRLVEREMRRLANEKKREDRKRVEESFAAWKMQKDVELRLQKKSKWNEEHLLPKPQSPGLDSLYKPFNSC